MGQLWDEIKWAWDMAGRPSPTPSNQPRNLTEADRLGWNDALDKRAKQPPPQTLESVRRNIRGKNPIRWHQLQRDLKWVQKEMKKMGLNPEDARYIL